MSNAVDAARRPYVVASIMLANFMVAIEATIVATAMPRIVGDLGGFSYYSWVFSAFLLTQSATTVVYGKLSDVFGRKPVLIFGIVVFLIGSLLSGFATSMAALIGFRLLQGIGAGAIQPVTMTIVGDLYTLEQRAKVQGVMSSVWAFAAVVGPLATLGTVLGQTNSGMGVFQKSLSLMASALAPILLPVMVLFSTAVVSAADVLHGSLIPALKRWTDIVMKLNAAVNESLKQPAVAEKVNNAALVIVPMTPDEMIKTYDQEMPFYTEAAALIGFKPQ